MSIISSTVQCIPRKDNAESFDTSTSIGGRLLCNLWFADDITLLGGSGEELAERLEKTAAGYSMEISSSKTKILINSTKPRPSHDSRMNGKTLE